MEKNPTNKCRCYFFENNFTIQYEWVKFIIIIIVYLYVEDNGMNSGHKIIVLFTRNSISSDIDSFPFHSMYTHYTRILHINKSEKN